VQQFTWLQPHFASRDGKMIISFQCFALRSKGRTAMIDTCIGNDRKREFDVFCNMQKHLPRGLEHSRFPRRNGHRCVVHASALRSRRLEHPAHRRQVGADFSQARYLFGRREMQH